MSQYNGMQTFLDNAPAPFQMGEYVDYTTIPLTKVSGSGIPKIVILGIVVLVAIFFLKGK